MRGRERVSYRMNNGKGGASGRKGARRDGNEPWGEMSD